MRVQVVIGAVRLWCACLGLAVLVRGECPAQPPAARAPGSGRWALLIGVDDYLWARKLEYCGADMRALGQQLATCGFPKDHVYVLHDKAEQNKDRPTKASIEAHLQTVLRLVEQDDLAVVGFSGHGVHIDGKSYLCPAEAKLDDPSSLVSVDGLYELLHKSPAAMKLLLLDACRNDPRPSGQRGFQASEGTRQFAQSLERPPHGILLLTSCAPGEIAREDQEFGHGVFMHFLLQGLAGRADANGNGRVSLMELYLYANEKTKTYVAGKFVDSQRPALKGDIHDDFDLTQPFAPARLISNSIGMKLALIQPGEFTMGSNDSDKYAPTGQPQHRVRITKAFYVGVHEVTVGQFRQFVEQTRHRTKAEKDGAARTWQNPGFPQTDEHPVVRVSWNDAAEFCKWLSAREGTTYALPTEAQWEYACRAGSTTRYSFGDNADRLADFAWFGENATRGTRPAGQKMPNAWGLFDVHGNVWEWCADWHDSDYYRRSPVDDPPGPTAGSHRVLRSGSWSFVNPVYFQCASLIARVPADCVDDCGFRVVRRLGP